ncbi:MAG TPA: hypothetical protein VGN42_20440 [Pirellulales bacterium]|jgi:hypothetical protein|nr:hypothetical protein [Pirellulales bacterium]
MKSVLGALAYLGAIYASCVWLGATKDHEVRYSEADRRRHWTVISPPTLRLDDSLEYDSGHYGGEAETAAVDRRPTI